MSTERLRVLIVEDDAIVAMLLEDMVRELGHAVAGVAGRLAQGVALAREADADVAVIDLNLAGEHSYPIAEILRARGIPFVFATGYDADGLAPEWQSALTMQKPFLLDDLRGAVSAALAAKNA